MNPFTPKLIATWSLYRAVQVTPDYIVIERRAQDDCMGMPRWDQVKAISRCDQALTFFLMEHGR